MKNPDLLVHLMKMQRVRPFCLMIPLILGLALIGSTPLAAQNSCQPVNDAMDKVITTPTHIYSVMTPVRKDGGEPRPDDVLRSETIYVGGSAYTKLGGKWTRGGWTPQQVMKQEQENRQNSHYSCRYLRDEPVNGEMAAVYTTHSERADMHIKSDGQVWISKSKGLPLRHEFDIESLGLDKDHPDKQHHSVRYEYTNAQPPM